jgi:hypothetical protein
MGHNFANGTEGGNPQFAPGRNASIVPMGSGSTFRGTVSFVPILVQIFEVALTHQKVNISFGSKIWTRGYGRSQLSGGCTTIEQCDPYMRGAMRILSRERHTFAIWRDPELAHQNAW